MVRTCTEVVHQVVGMMTPLDTFSGGAPTTNIFETWDAAVPCDQRFLH